jgi:hypothetical protein
VVLGGVIQEPESAYSIDQSQIIFAAAPGALDDFFCIALGVALGVGVPADGTVSGSKLSSPFNYNSGLLYLDSANNRIGVATVTPQFTLDVNGDINLTGTFYQNSSPFVASRWTAGTGNDIYRLNGNVGIGTTNPTSKLHIIGDVLVGGIITATTFSGGIISGTTGTFSSQIQSTQANSTATGGGQIYLNGSNGNRIDFNTDGVNLPSFTTRSTGTKVVLYPSISGSSVDYSLGIAAGVLWNSIPAYDAGMYFKWFGGETEIASLSGTGNLTATSLVKSGGTSSQFLKADGSVDSSTYLTSYTETDTLNSVTNRGNSTSNGISVGVITATTFSGSGASLTSIPNSATTATNANTVSAIVARDVSGNFSAGTITATLSGSSASVANAATFNSGGAGAVSGTTFNGSAAQTISYNTIGASPLAGSSSLVTTGTVTSGTWSGSFGAVSGANLTTLNASNLSSGTVATARLASGTANATTYLRGDQTWASISGGGGATLSNDTTTNATYYPTFSSATSGTYSTAYVSNTKCTFNPSTGTLSATQFTSLSDQTLKTNIRPIEDSVALVQRLQGVRFDWLGNSKPSIGVIAQEVEEILPEVVETNEDGTKSVSYGNLVGVLIEAIKEQQVRIEELERKLNA